MGKEGLRRAGSSWRALRVMRPAREKKRRRGVLVVAIGSPIPMRPVQQARLWEMTCTARQAMLPGNGARGDG